MNLFNKLYVSKEVYQQIQLKLNFICFKKYIIYIAALVSYFCTVFLWMQTASGGKSIWEFEFLSCLMINYTWFFILQVLIVLVFKMKK